MMNTDTAATAPTTRTLGARVAVNDPKWHRHGEVGTVVTVNRKTIRVQMSDDPIDVVVGSPLYFVTV